MKHRQLMQNAKQLQQQQQSARDNKEMSEGEGEKRRNAKRRTPTPKCSARKCKSLCVQCECVCVRRRQANILYRQAATLLPLLTPSPSTCSLYHLSLPLFPSACTCISILLSAFAFPMPLPPVLSAFWHLVASLLAKCAQQKTKQSARRT